MKTLLISAIFSVFSFSLVAQLASHTNAGFSVVAGLGEGKSFTTYTTAIDRIISGFESPVLAKTFENAASQCMQNAEVSYMGGNSMPADSIANILRWLKDHPEDSKDFQMRVFKLSAGTSYTFMTLSVVNGKLVFGKQIIRDAHEGEWALEMFGQMFCSTWCLNLFPSTGKIVKATPNQKPSAPAMEPLNLKQQDLGVCAPREEPKQPRPGGMCMRIVTAVTTYQVDGHFAGTSYSDVVAFLTWDEIDSFRVQEGFPRYKCGGGKISQRYLENISPGDSRARSCGCN